MSDSSLARMRQLKRELANAKDNVKSAKLEQARVQREIEAEREDHPDVYEEVFAKKTPARQA